MESIYIVWDNEGVLGAFEIKSDAAKTLDNFLLESGYLIDHWEEGRNYTAHYCTHEGGLSNYKITIEEVELNQAF